MAASARDYEGAKEHIRLFLTDFMSEDDLAPKYEKLLQDIANRARRTLDIELDDVQSFSTDQDFMNNILTNTRRYLTLFSEVVDEMLPEPTASHGVDDVFDVLMRQRREHADAEADGADGNVDNANRLPAELTRRYEVRFKPPAKEKGIAVREVKAQDIGKLVTIKGIVTKVMDVKPLLSVATYTCDDCGFEIYQMVTGNTYMPIMTCPSSRCKTNKDNGQLFPQTRGSKFIKFQEVKIQELSDQVPIGNIPRTLTIHVTGELTRHVQAGDVIDVSGVFLPVPFTGYKAMKAGLTADVYLDAMSIHKHKKSYTEFALTDERRALVQRLAETPDIYSQLSRSLAPEIYGHEDVKRALLLLLVGAPTRETKDGMKLRGDIHICLMGDPGVAKSQLLKHIASVAPRGVYTTGRGSSGVGLTAAVTRDPVTSEFVLEGGALVLADNGICCIDEFDKMEESDRTAIHEVMEQQTVSIAKAGITTSLNARTAVLAAANPAFSRWNLKRTPSENIALPAALLSRFDLLWLILDNPESEADTALAQHVVHVHRHLRAPDLDFEPLAPEVIRSYVAVARSYVPSIAVEMTEYVASVYAEMRAEEAGSDRPTGYTTARTLLSILRLSEALARLRLSDKVGQSDVDEALRLMKMSKISLDENQRNRAHVDPLSAIYGALRDYAIKHQQPEITFDKAKQLAMAKNCTVDQLVACLEEYQELGVWSYNDNHDIEFPETDILGHA